jgi:segregation and condensation protein B
MTDNLKNIIEALLFASDIPLPIQKLKEILEVDSVKYIRKGLDDLEKHYKKTESAMRIIEVAGGFQIVSKEEYAIYVQKLYKGRQASRLTQRALETLAIVAYKQPITKHEIENIRGVNVDGVVKTLLERNLITIEGREKAPGNPLLYGTTKYFLEYFGLKSLEALPKLKEIDELLKEDDKFLESLDQVALRQLEPEVLGLTSLEESSVEELKSKSNITDESQKSDHDETESKSDVTEKPSQSVQDESESNSDRINKSPQSDQEESVKRDASE